MLCCGTQVLWNVDSGEAICGSPTHADFVLCCRFFSNQSDKLITAGNYNLQVSRLWSLNSGHSGRLEGSFCPCRG